MTPASKLVPADLTQCQAQIPNGATAFTCGGIPELIRCKNKPAYMAVEINPGEDGLRGYMTLCTDCKDVFLIQCGLDRATLIPFN